MCVAVSPNTSGSRGLTARLCFPSSHVRANVCSTSLSSVLELGSAAWCSQWRPFSSQHCSDSRRISRKRLSKLAWTMLPPWRTALEHHLLNCGRGDSAWNLWERHAVVLATWIQTWLRVGPRVTTYPLVVLLLCVFCFFPIVFLSCFSLSPLTFPQAHLSPLLCLESRPLVAQSCADRFSKVTQAIGRGQLKETDEDSNEDGIIESWVMSGVGVSVETKLHEEDLGENPFLTKLPVQRQLSSSAKTDERVDESSVPRSRKNRARSSVVFVSRDAATQNPLTPQQDQQLRSTLQSHQVYCSSTGRWSRTIQFRLGTRENLQHWRYRYRGRQPQTPRWRQTGHNPQGERTHSEEVYRLVHSGPRSHVPPRRYTTCRNIPSDETFRTMYAWRL